MAGKPGIKTAKKAVPKPKRKNPEAERDRIIKKFAPWAFIVLFGTLGIYYLVSSFAASSLIKAGQFSVHLTDSAGKSLCLGDSLNGNVIGTTVIASPCNKFDSEQQWSIYSDNTIRIHGSCLDEHQNSRADGANVGLSACNSSASQQWNIVPISRNSSNNIIDKASGRCLNASKSTSVVSISIDTRVCNGTNAQSWSWSTTATDLPGGE